LIVIEGSGGIMTFDEKDFTEGVSLGTARARVKLDDNLLKLSSRRRMLIRGCLDRSSSELNGRFVELFVELTTLALITRSKYEEPDLADAELDDFLAHSISFFNSFRHKVVEGTLEPLRDAGPNSIAGNQALAGKS
jgi:hypothetical protein